MASGRHANEAVKQSVSAHIGIGIISRHGIELELETKRLCVLDVVGFPIVRNWYPVHRKEKRLSTAASAFAQYCSTRRPNFLRRTDGPGNSDRAGEKGGLFAPRIFKEQQPFHVMWEPVGRGMAVQKVSRC